MLQDTPEYLSCSQPLHSHDRERARLTPMCKTLCFFIRVFILGGARTRGWVGVCVWHVRKGQIGSESTREKESMRSCVQGRNNPMTAGGPL